MQTSNIHNFKAGWFIGAFQPTLLTTPFFEIAIHNYPQGFIGEAHYHKIATEYNIIISGLLIASGKRLGANDIFIYSPDEISDVEFLTDTKLLIIKTPSVPGDKYLCQE